jgi:hypothetical protein
MALRSLLRDRKEALRRSVLLTPVVSACLVLAASCRCRPPSGCTALAELASTAPLADGAVAAALLATPPGPVPGHAIAQFVAESGGRLVSAT